MGFIILLFAFLGFLGTFPYYGTREYASGGLTFFELRTNAHLLSFFLYLIIFIWFLVGFSPFNQWNKERGSGKDNSLIASVRIIFSVLLGLYTLIRFGLDFNKGAIPFYIAIILEIAGIGAALMAGIQGFLARESYDRIVCLLGMNVALFIQMVSAICANLAMKNPHLPAAYFSYDILFYTLFVQLLGFSLLFVFEYCLSKVDPSKKAFLLPYLYALGFLLSGCFPFTGFALMWGNLQSWFGILWDHSLLNILLIIMIVGTNAVIIAFSLLGWIGLVQAEREHCREFQDIKKYDSFISLIRSPIGKWIASLYGVCLCPASITYFLNPISGSDKSMSVITFWGVAGNHVSLIPIIPFMAVICIMYIGRYWVRRNQSDISSSSSSVEEINQRFPYCETTCFNFDDTIFYHRMVELFPLHIGKSYCRQLNSVMIRIRTSLSGNRDRLNGWIWNHHKRVVLGVFFSILFAELFIR